MPIATKEMLETLLSEEHNLYVTLDTSTFKRQGFSFAGAELNSLKAIKDRSIDLIVTRVVVDEVARHLSELLQKKISEIKNNAIYSGEVIESERKKFNNISNKDILNRRINADFAKRVFLDFINLCGGYQIEDILLIELQSVYEAYRDGQPPFSNKKKNEFPDAFALYALELYSNNFDGCCIVISTDSDWKEFCELSTRLYYVDSIGAFLDVLFDPQSKLKDALATDFLNNDTLDEIDDIVNEFLKSQHVNIEIDSGTRYELFDEELECTGYHFPIKDSLSILHHSSLKTIDRFTIRIDAQAIIKASAQVEFFAWDSVDRESIFLESKEISKSFGKDIQMILEIKLSKKIGNRPQFKIKNIDFSGAISSIYLGSHEPFEY